MENNDTNTAPRVKRPFFLTFLCIIGFTYTALFSLFFLLGLLYSSGISGILDKYLQIYDLSRLNFFLFALGGFAIFFSSFVGVLLMWRMHWLGFYIYVASAVVFISLEMIISGFYLPDLIVHAALVLLFLLAMIFVSRKKKAAFQKETHEKDITT